jgi:hypothetical protein
MDAPRHSEAATMAANIQHFEAFGFCTLQSCYTPDEMADIDRRVRRTIAGAAAAGDPAYTCYQQPAELRQGETAWASMVGTQTWAVQSCSHIPVCFVQRMLSEPLINIEQGGMNPMKMTRHHRGLGGPVRGAGPGADPVDALRPAGAPARLGAARRRPGLRWLRVQPGRRSHGRVCH